MMMNKMKGVALAVMAAIMLVGTTVSLAPVASVQASGQEVENSLSLENSQSLPSGERDNIVTSNDASENSAAKNTIERDHDVKQASAAGERALDLERTIKTPNKEIKIDVESDDNSQASKSHQEDSSFFCLASLGCTQ